MKPREQPGRQTGRLARPVSHRVVRWPVSPPQRRQPRPARPRLTGCRLPSQGSILVAAMASSHKGGFSQHLLAQGRAAKARCKSPGHRQTDALVRTAKLDLPGSAGKAPSSGRPLLCCPDRGRRECGKGLAEESRACRAAMVSAGNGLLLGRLRLRGTRGARMLWTHLHSKTPTRPETALTVRIPSRPNSQRV